MDILSKPSPAPNKPSWIFDANLSLSFSSLIIALIPSIFPKLFLNFPWTRIGLPLVTLAICFLPSVLRFLYSSVKIALSRIREYPEVRKYAQTLQAANIIVSKELSAILEKTGNGKPVKILEVRISNQKVFLDIDHHFDIKLEVGGKIYALDTKTVKYIGVFVIKESFTGFVRAEEEWMDPVWKSYQLSNPDYTVLSPEIKCDYFEIKESINDHSTPRTN